MTELPTTTNCEDADDYDDDDDDKADEDNAIA